MGGTLCRHPLLCQTRVEVEVIDSFRGGCHGYVTTLSHMLTNIVYNNITISGQWILLHGLLRKQC